MNRPFLVIVDGVSVIDASGRLMPNRPVEGGAGLTAAEAVAAIQRAAAAANPGTLTELRLIEEAKS